MPIRSYKRAESLLQDIVHCQCIKGFDVLQKMNAENLTTCPVCGFKLRRDYMQSFGVQFNGQGFYCTDNPK